MGAPTGGGKGGGGGAGLGGGTGAGLRPMNTGAAPMMPPANAGGGMARPAVNPQSYSGGNNMQQGGLGQAMRPPQQMQQQAPQQDLHSIMRNPNDPMNPMSQIGGQMKNMMTQGEGIVKTIFSGQWKDSLGLGNTMGRTESLMGSSIANPGTGMAEGTAISGGPPKPPMNQPVQQGGGMAGVSNMTNPQTATEAQPSPVVNVAKHIEDTQNKLTSYIQSAPNMNPQSNTSVIPPVGGMYPQTGQQSAQLQQATTPSPTPVGTNSTGSIGDLAASYEVSEMKGQPLQSQVGFISKGMGGKDPGGISYGRYQLETNKGTMQEFLKSPEGQKFSNLQGVKINSPEFRSEWQKTAAADPQAFDQAQFNYLKTKAYDKAIPIASQKGFDVEHPAVQQALFSTANQSGGWKNILNKAGVKPGDSVEMQINKLYDARANYFKNLDLSPDVKSSIIKNRTIDERRDALALIGA